MFLTLKFLIVFSVLVSLIVCFVVVLKVREHASRVYPKESKYTKLFTVLTKEHFTYMYIFAILIHAAFSVWFIAVL